MRLLALSRFKVPLFNKMYQQQLITIFQKGILNMLWIPMRTKRILSNLKRHLPMKYLGAFKTTNLAFIEYQQ